MLKEEHLISLVFWNFFFLSSEITLKNKGPQLTLTLITWKQNLNRKIWFLSAPSPNPIASTIFSLKFNKSWLIDHASECYFHLIRTPRSSDSRELKQYLFIFFQYSIQVLGRRNTFLKGGIDLLCRWLQTKLTICIFCERWCAVKKLSKDFVSFAWYKIRDTRDYAVSKDYKQMTLRLDRTYKCVLFSLYRTFIEFKFISSLLK